MAMGERVVDYLTHQLILDVMDGNPGAFTIIRHLMSSAIWYQLLQHLKSQQLIGSELWRVVKDTYAHDYRRFIDDQLDQMPPERSQTLRALRQHPTLHRN
jgi:hypothetical protein